MMSSPPTGTVTCLFTDFEGITNLARMHPVAWESARARHRAILREAVAARHDFVCKVIGDTCWIDFSAAPDTLATVLTAQRALEAQLAEVTWTPAWAEG